MNSGGAINRNPIADVDAKVEKSMVQVLEQKYQDAIQLLDKAELKKDRAVFEADIAKKEKQKYLDMYNRAQGELSETRFNLED